MADRETRSTRRFWALPAHCKLKQELGVIVIPGRSFVSTRCKVTMTLTSALCSADVLFLDLIKPIHIKYRIFTYTIRIHLYCRFMKRILICSLTLLLCFTSCLTPQVDLNTPAKSEQELFQHLEQAYLSSDRSALKSFFKEWELRVPARKPESLQSDTIKVIHDVFQTFYRPLSLGSLGNWEGWTKRLNMAADHIVVGTKVYFVVKKGNISDDLEAEYSIDERDSIVDFRPYVNTRKPVLYLTSKYFSVLNKFLGSESTPVGEDNIMDPAMPKGESKKRSKFLVNHIPLAQGHWGGYWHMDSHPRVNLIVLNRTLTKARIYFRVGYQGGEAILEKKGKHWKLLESGATWIE